MTVDQDLDSEYRPHIPEREAILARWAREASAYRERWPFTSISYGGSPRQVIELFEPAHCAPRIVVFAHGGYWQQWEPGMFSHVARALNERDVAVALVGYDLCPSVRLATIVAQLREAYLALRASRRRRLVGVGHSAGGHLTACMLATAWSEPGLVEAGVTLSGVFDLAPLVATTINDKLGLDAAEARRWSPLHERPIHGCTLDAFVGACESASFHEQSRALQRAWAEQGIGSTYRVIPGANHLTIVDELARIDSPIVERLATLAND